MTAWIVPNSPRTVIKSAHPPRQWHKELQRFSAMPHPPLTAILRQEPERAVTKLFSVCDKTRGLPDRRLMQLV